MARTRSPAHPDALDSLHLQRTTRREMRVTISAANLYSKAFTMRHRLLFLLALGIIPTVLFAKTAAWQPAPGHAILPICPNAAPGSQPNSPAEIDTTRTRLRYASHRAPSHRLAPTSRNLAPHHPGSDTLHFLKIVSR
jgi:hypothetical protein